MRKDHGENIYVKAGDTPGHWPFKYFKPDEIRCRCCGEILVHVPSLTALDSARLVAGIPFIVNSGYRCGDHNRRVGGAIGSEHLRGRAFDIAAPTMRQRWQVIRACSRAGFDGVGVYTKFVHVDTGRLRFWTG